MDRATLSQRIESILNEITRLSNTLYAMDNTNIQRHSDNYEMLSTEAALRGEVIACRLRHLIYETTTDTHAAQVPALCCLLFSYLQPRAVPQPGA